MDWPVCQCAGKNLSRRPRLLQTSECVTPWKEQMHWRQVQYTVHINIHDRINLQAMLPVNHIHTHTHAREIWNKAQKWHLNVAISSIWWWQSTNILLCIWNISIRISICTKHILKNIFWHKIRCGPSWPYERNKNDQVNLTKMCRSYFSLKQSLVLLHYFHYTNNQPF